MSVLGTEVGISGDGARWGSEGRGRSGRDSAAVGSSRRAVGSLGFAGVLGNIQRSRLTRGRGYNGLGRTPARRVPRDGALGLLRPRGGCPAPETVGGRPPALGRGPGAQRGGPLARLGRPGRAGAGRRRAADQRARRRDRLHRQHHAGDRPDRRGLPVAPGRLGRDGGGGIPLEPLPMDEPGLARGERPDGPDPRRRPGLGRGPGRRDRLDDARADDQPRRVRQRLPQRPGRPGRDLPRQGRRAVRGRDPGLGAVDDRRPADPDRLPGGGRAQVAPRARRGGPALRPPRVDRPAPGDRGGVEERRVGLQQRRGRLHAQAERGPLGGRDVRDGPPAGVRVERRPVFGDRARGGLAADPRPRRGGPRAGPVGRLDGLRVAEAGGRGGDRLDPPAGRRPRGLRPSASGRGRLPWPAAAAGSGSARTSTTTPTTSAAWPRPSAPRAEPNPRPTRTARARPP